jgi:hypothetical protein
MPPPGRVPHADPKRSDDSILINLAVVQAAAGRSAKTRMELTPAYFKKRAAEERAKADHASSAEARRVHVELAFRHEQVATELHLEWMGAQARDSRSPDERRSPRSFGRAELGRAINSAFPLPDSGAFPDLLDALDDADRAIGTARRDS